jgi:hypothetical protein
LGLAALRDKIGDIDDFDLEVANEINGALVA